MPKIKIEDAETTIEKRQYRPLHPVHFEELERIWEADRRIPTVPSRRAWAEARNSNPANVHSWWYRRRPLARKLKVKIPREEYELDVGVPPVIPEAEEVNTEISTAMHEILGSSDIGSETSSAVLGMSDTQTSCALDEPSLAKNALFEELSAEMSTYMRSSSPFPDLSWPDAVPSLTSRYSTPSRDSSLPPSSPPRPTSTPPPCHLIFPEDMMVEDDKISALDSIASEEICSSTSYVPRSFSDQLSRTSETALQSSDRVSLPLFSTWCLSGYRISYDGCFLGFCSCFTDDDSQNC